MRPLGPLGMISASAALALVAAFSVATPAHAELEFVTQWGSPTDGQLIQPFAIERDSSGNTYVADIGRPSVQEFDSSGNYVRSFGSYAANSVPTAVAVNLTTGDLYVAVFSDLDSPTPNAQIRRYDSSGNLLGSFGSLGTGAGQFAAVNGLAVDSANGDLYVADAGNNRIQKLNAAGGFLRMWGKDIDPAGGTGFEVSTCVVGCKVGVRGDLKGELDRPADVAIDSNVVPHEIYVSDGDNNRIQKFNSNGAFLLMAGRDVVAGNAVTGAEVCTPADVCQRGVPGSGDGELDSPQAIDTVDPFGSPLIADGDNTRVQRWTSGLGFLAAFGSQGDADGQFRSIYGLAEASGRIVTADPDAGRVQQFSLGGGFLARFGDPAPSTLIFPLFARLGSGGIAAGSGGIYVDDERNRLLRFDPGGGFVGILGTAGAGSGQFALPRGIATDPAGNVFVADTGNSRIQKLDADGAALAAWGSIGTATGQFDTLADVAVASDGAAVFTTESSRVQKFSPIGGFLGTWGAVGNANGQLNGASGVATDAAGNVYVADAGNDRIEKFDAGGNFVGAWGSEGKGDGQFDSPLDVAVDPLGNVFVVDRKNNRVQRFDSAGTFLGRFGAGGGDGTAGGGPGEFRRPIAIAIDAAGDIYVLDRDNARVEKFAHADAPPTSVAPDLTIASRRRQDPAKLRVRVDCGGVPCTVTLRGKVRAVSRRRKARTRRTFARGLKPKTVAVDGSGPVSVMLKLKKQRRSVRLIGSLLEDGARGSAIVRGSATNAAGSDKARRRLRLKP